MSSEFANRARLFREALSDALDGVDGAAPDDGLVDGLALLVRQALPMAGEDETAIGALEALEAIAKRGEVEGAVSEAAALFESPQRFREALYFARCLQRDSGAALELVRARGYLAGATVPGHAFPELSAGQATLLDQTTFALLWQEPVRLQRMLEEIEAWRQAYIPLYVQAHRQYNDAIASVAGQVEALQWKAAAIEKLNGLRRLGAPVAEAALTRFHGIEGLLPCPADDGQLRQMLTSGPLCRFCEFRPGDEAPFVETERLAQELEEGLSRQRERLTLRVLSRLSSGGYRDERLQRFTAAVQGSDARALAESLDEGLVQFLDDLLLVPDAGANLLDRLAQRYPEATVANMEEVIEGFRRLLTDELARNGGSVSLASGDEHR